MPSFVLQSLSSGCTQLEYTGKHNLEYEFPLRAGRLTRPMRWGRQRFAQ
jgi:hypothetical protein